MSIHEKGSKPGGGLNSPDEWFLLNENETHGPFTTRELKELLRRRKLTPPMKARNGSSGEWLDMNNLLVRMQSSRHQKSQAPLKASNRQHLFLFAAIAIVVGIIATLAASVAITASKASQAQREKNANYAVENASKTARDAMDKGDLSDAAIIIEDALKIPFASQFGPVFKVKAKLILANAIRELDNGDTASAEKLIKSAVAIEAIEPDDEKRCQELLDDLHIVSSPDAIRGKLKSLDIQRLETFISSAKVPDELALHHPYLTEKMTSESLRLAQSTLGQIIEEEARKAAAIKKETRLVNVGKVLRRVDAEGSASINSTVAPNALFASSTVPYRNRLTVYSLSGDGNFFELDQSGKKFDSIYNSQAFSPASDAIAFFNMLGPDGPSESPNDNLRRERCVTIWKFGNANEIVDYFIPKELFVGAGDSEEKLSFRKPASVHLTQGHLIALVDYSVRSRDTSVVLVWDRMTGELVSSRLFGASSGRPAIGNPIEFLRVSPDGQYAVGAGAESGVSVSQNLLIWELFGDGIREIHAESQVMDAVFDAEGERLFVAGFDCVLRELDFVSGEINRSWTLAEHDPLMEHKHRLAVTDHMLGEIDRQLLMNDGIYREAPPVPRWGFGSITNVHVSPGGDRVYCNVLGPQPFLLHGSDVVINLETDEVVEVGFEKSGSVVGFDDDGDSVILHTGSAFVFIGVP